MTNLRPWETLKRAVGECRVPTPGRDARTRLFSEVNAHARRCARPCDRETGCALLSRLRAYCAGGASNNVLRADASPAYAEPALLRARKCGARFPAGVQEMRRARRVRRWEGARPTTRSSPMWLRVHRRDEGSVERAAQCIRTRQGHILEHQSRPRNVRRYERREATTTPCTLAMSRSACWARLRRTSTIHSS